MSERLLRHREGSARTFMRRLSPRRVARRYRLLLRRRLADLSIPYKLALIITIFSLIICTLLVVGNFGLGVLSDVRAYVGGEGLWSKAQKDAVYSLIRYTVFRDEKDYQQYLQYLTVPLGDRKARLQLQQPATDFHAVETGFIEGRNHPSDVAGMARLFKRFFFISYIREAAAAWKEGDQHLSELMALGEDIHQYVLHEESSPKKVKEFLSRIDALNAKLTPIEDRFSYTLGEGARWLTVVLLWVMLGVVGVLLVLGLLVAISITRRLTDEIYRLRDAAARIAKGDFSQQIDVAAADEIGDLARSFQQMAAQRELAEAALDHRAKELDEANKRLIETERMKDNFFATVSHELRTPLTLVLSPVESLLAGEYGSLPAPQKQMLEMMHNNTVRLLQMVTGLLDFSKFEAGRMEVKREPTDLVTMTQALLSDFQPIITQKGLHLECQTDPLHMSVLIDRYLYERIVFNLLSNAVKFTSEGGTVSVTLSWTEDRLKLTVRDTGIGIADEDLQRLFQKFQQLEGASTRRFEGTGLGLALVKEFAALLEGTVSVESHLGLGSTFTVECAAPSAELLATQASEGHSATRLVQRFAAGPPCVEDTQQDTNGSPTVLVAEDNTELARYIAALLRETCHVTIARDGEEALEMVRRHPVDLVISDVMMPKRDGLSLCRAIKSQQETAAIPVILLTALTYREALLKGWEAGADEYLFKPFHPKELVTRVTSMLANFRRRKRAEEERDRIFNLSLDLLCVSGFDGYFKQLNPQWERTLGFTAKELCAKPSIEFVHPHDRASSLAEAEKLAAGAVTTTFENRYLCKDGSYKWLLWNAVPLPERQLIYAAARDISERIRAEQQLKRAHTDLKKSHEELKTAHLQLIQAAKLESVGRLAAGVAHEVKNPLAIILQGLDYLSRHMTNGNGNGDSALVLKYTGDAVRRADAVIRGLLDFSTMRELVLAADDLNPVVEQALLLVKHELDKSHITVAKTLEASLPRVRFDPNKMEQVFVNVFMNAIYAMPEGGALTVKTSAKRLTEVGYEVGTREHDRFQIGDTVVIVDIEDTGTGIPEEALQKIFDPFFTTKPTGKGTGLGLTVTKKIVELHGGMITVRNREAGGVQVTVVLKTEGRDQNGQNTHSAD